MTTSYSSFCLFVVSQSAAGFLFFVLNLWAIVWKYLIKNSLKFTEMKYLPLWTTKLLYYYLSCILIWFFLSQIISWKEEKLFYRPFTTYYLWFLFNYVMRFQYFFLSCYWYMILIFFFLLWTLNPKSWTLNIEPQTRTQV